MNKDDPTSYYVVIIGAGIAGLTCANELLKIDPNIRVTIVEASDHPGGRIRGQRCHGIDVDIGAEFIHGPGTVLTDLIEDLYGGSAQIDGTQTTPIFDKNNFSSEIYEPIFVVSHADGGPDTELTVDGKYGMYYMDGSLRPFDDPSALELRAALDDLFYPEESDVDNNERQTSCIAPLQDDVTSIGEALDRAKLSSAAQKLAISSYGNTAANVDLYSLSLPIMQQFENYWFKCTTPGDFRFNSSSGISMVSVLEKFVTRLKKEQERLQFLYNWKVRSIRQQKATHSVGNGKQKDKAVKIESDSDGILFADAVVVTVSPPMLQELDMELSTKKKHALSLVGFPRVVKVTLIFSSPESPWPKKLNGIICADGLPIPEIWFAEKIANLKSDGTQDEAKNMNDTTNVLYLAVGYLTSQIADDFILKVHGGIFLPDLGEEDRNDGTFSLANMVSRHASAARIFIHQLAQVLNISEESLNESCIDCILYDWKVDEPMVRGGYMYGKKGMATQHLYDLAEPQNNIFFAGEATNTNACCTVQAAMETGIRAANEVLHHLPKSR